jgi:hypothetical protein
MALAHCVCAGAMGESQYYAAGSKISECLGTTSYNGWTSSSCKQDGTGMLNICQPGQKSYTQLYGAFASQGNHRMQLPFDGPLTKVRLIFESS